jgi:PTS system nitrogen regulatory IIA component
LFLETQNKEETINKLIDVSYKIPEIKNREQLAEAVFNREKLMSTGIGLGIGVPHVRLKGMKNLYMSMAINKNGITDYDSLDDIPVKIVILIIASNTQHSRYIKVLSQIAQIMKDTEIHKNLMNAKNSEEIFKILKEGNNK